MMRQRALSNCFLLPFLIFSSISQIGVAGESLLGINYQQITQNEVLTGFMLLIEPRLVQHYQASEYEALRKPEMILIQVKGIAATLAKDGNNKSNFRLMRKVSSPEEITSLLQLDKQKYPNFWNFAELVRLEIEIDKNKRLYQALHGKPFQENSSN